MNTQPLIDAIRNDPKVGRGSCTSVDECFDDSDLVELFEREGITTPEAAVKAAYEIEGLRLEAALNARWGEDDDPQLKAYNEWHNKG